MTCEDELKIVNLRFVEEISCEDCVYWNAYGPRYCRRNGECYPVKSI